MMLMIITVFAQYHHAEIYSLPLLARVFDRDRDNNSWFTHLFFSWLLLKTKLFPKLHLKPPLPLLNGFPLKQLRPVCVQLLCQDNPKRLSTRLCILISREASAASAAKKLDDFLVPCASPL